MSYLVSLISIVETVYKGWSEFIPVVILKSRIDLFLFVLKHLLQFKQELPRRRQQDLVV